MAKVLLVEDDNNLREIFEMRIQAEGYDTVTAGDGEEGLVVAMKERPDLIVADVMMPKLSGFEMLETLRAAPEMANTKVIMMTALGQAEDQARGESLGVVKYLVKSQVTLEDFARVIKEVLDGSKADSASPATVKTDDDNNDSTKDEGSDLNNKKESENNMPEDNTMGVPVPDPSAAPAAEPAAPAPDVANPISSVPGMDSQPSTASEQSAVNDQINNFVSSAPADPSATVAATDPLADSADPTVHADVPVAEPPVESALPGSESDSAPAGSPPVV